MVQAAHATAFLRMEASYEKKLALLEARQTEHNTLAKEAYAKKLAALEARHQKHIAAVEARHAAIEAKYAAIETRQKVKLSASERALDDKQGATISSLPLTAEESNEMLKFLHAYKLVASETKKVAAQNLSLSLSLSFNIFLLGST